MNVLPIKTKSKHYNIYIGNNIIPKLKKIVKKEKINFDKYLIIVDKNVPKMFLNKIKSNLNFKKKLIYYFKPSEKNKNLS